jgi:flagellar hook-associated protein 1 FlgK
MSSTFGGIQQATNSIGAARYGLEIVSQNIANANTPGYTRQASQQATVDAVAGVPTLYTKPAGPGGVQITGTARLNDPVLDARSRTEHARSGLADTNAAALTSIESLFPEPSDNGLSEQLNAFWKAWTPVANDPGSQAPRSVLLQRAATVASTLNAMSTSLSDVADSATQSLTQGIDAVNSAATQLGNINGQIAVAAATGANANSLMDQRDQLLDQLSTMVGGVATINANGSADVVVGGQSLVSGVTVNAMAFNAGTNTVSVGGTAVTLVNGSASAFLSTLVTTVPAYQAQLDTVANTLAATVNAGQAAGYDLAGNAGGPLFGGTGAANLSVIITDPTLVAASSTPGGNLDGSNALTLSGKGAESTSADALYTKLVGNIGSSTALAKQQQTTQSSVTASVDALRTSVSGVSYDEEVSNMLTFQRSYQASSRVLTTLDDLLDTLINHTGLVGRG